MITTLMLDDWYLNSRINMVRRLGRPQWVPEGVLEDNITDGTWNWPFVRRDPDTGRWLAWYLGHYHDRLDGPRLASGLNIAESDDGIHWIKPDLTDRVPLQNRNRPNQVLSVGECDGGPVFYDPFDPDPDRRYKLIYSDEELMHLATSGDGYHWNVEPFPWTSPPQDAPTSAFYNHVYQTWMINCRPKHGDRRVAFTPTEDFKTHGAMVLVMHPDPEDPPNVQFYGMPVHRYEDMYIGFLWRLHTDPYEVRYHKRDGEVDCCLTYSYNGLTFNRAYHEPFIPRNDRSMYGGACIYPSSLVVDDNHQIRIYSGASKTGHFQTNEVTDAAITLHTLRLDGFAYLESYATTGKIITRCVQFNGPKLALNVKAPYGAVRTQISDPDGNPVPGFSFSDSVPFRGDELFYTPIWKGDPSLASIGDRIVHLEIELFHGEIYAIRGDFEYRIGRYT